MEGQMLNKLQICLHEKQLKQRFIHEMQIMVLQEGFQETICLAITIFLILTGQFFKAVDLELIKTLIFLKETLQQETHRAITQETLLTEPLMDLLKRRKRVTRECQEVLTRDLFKVTEASKNQSKVILYQNKSLRADDNYHETTQTQVFIRSLLKLLYLTSQSSQELDPQRFKFSISWGFGVLGFWGFGV